jgi:hypothetical protein
VSCGFTPDREGTYTLVFDPATDRTFCGVCLDTKVKVVAME